jgi:hypothetical protein
MSSRQVAMGLLEKVGASFTPKIAYQRAINKLRRHLEQNGLPTDLTQEEVDFLEDEMGIGVSGIGAKPDGSKPDETPCDDPKPDSIEQNQTPDPKPKPPKKEKVKKPSRGGFICDILANLPEEGMTLEEISKLANDRLVESGGKDNFKQTMHHARGLAGAAREWDMVKKADGKIFPA